MASYPIRTGTKRVRYRAGRLRFRPVAARRATGPDSFAWHHENDFDYRIRISHSGGGVSCDPTWAIGGQPTYRRCCDTARQRPALPARLIAVPEADRGAHY